MGNDDNVLAELFGVIGDLSAEITSRDKLIVALRNELDMVTANWQEAEAEIEAMDGLTPVGPQHLLIAANAAPLFAAGDRVWYDFYGDGRPRATWTGTITEVRFASVMIQWDRKINDSNPYEVKQVEFDDFESLYLL